MAAQAQINVRINAEVKAAGDRVIESLGLSTSEVVRMLWRKLAEGEQEARKVIDELAQESEKDRQAEIDRKLAALRKADESWDRFVKLVGLNPATHVPLSDEEMREARYQHILEKYGA